MNREDLIRFIVHLSCALDLPGETVKRAIRAADDSDVRRNLHATLDKELNLAREPQELDDALYQQVDADIARRFGGRS